MKFPRAAVLASSLAISGPALAQSAPHPGEPSAVAPVAGNEAPPWAKEALPPPSDDPPPPSARTNLLVAGLAATAGFYGIGFGTSYLWPSSPVAEDLRIPVVGPYRAVFNAGCGASERGCSTWASVARTALAAISGLGQTGGVLLLGQALFLDTDSRAASGGTSTHNVHGTRRGAASVETEVPQIQVAPVVDEHSVGLMFGGSF